MKVTIKNILLLSSKQLTGYLFVALSVVFDVPALFLNFYFVFYYEGSFTETGISIFIWMAVIAAGVSFLLRAVKIQAMKHKEPVYGAIPRALLSNKYLIVVVVAYTVFQIKFPPQSVLLFLWICIASRAVSKMLEGMSLKMFKLDWSDEV